MNNNDTNATTSNPADAPGPGDPRFGLAKVVDLVGQLIESTESMSAEVLGGPTPCSEYVVTDLLDHITMVMRRVAVIGAGQPWSAVEQDVLGSGWGSAYRQAAKEAMNAWTDSAKLEQMFEVPWGAMPGAPLLHTYTAELSVHGWDLATATGQAFSVPDDLLGGPLVAVKFIPAEGRGSEEVPFDEVVDPGPDAPVLLQLAGWAGRDVLGVAS